MIEAIERMEDRSSANLGTRRLAALKPASFPIADYVIQQADEAQSQVDVLLVNPPAPDNGIWIRSQHRVGRRSRENMVWPQVDLAQMAALLSPPFKVAVVDAIAERTQWDEFEAFIRRTRPLYYVTQVTAPTLQNDMYGTFLAKSVGAKTIAFGTHVTPMPRQMLLRYPSLDFVLRGEPELTLVELIETLEALRNICRPERDGGGSTFEGNNRWEKLFLDADPEWKPAWKICRDAQWEGEHAAGAGRRSLSAIKGLAWRNGDEIAINVDRPFIRDLDALPMPLHHLLPFKRYRMPLLKGPFTFIETSRGCPAGCVYCIKHVSYNYTVRLRSPEYLLKELWELDRLGIHNIHMYSDLFTVSRDQVVDLANLIIKEGPKIRWMCNSRVDYVDQEMLQLMARSGCWLISWGIESASEDVLKRARKGYRMEQAPQALEWAKRAGIMNWGYFIIGLPGETEETIRQTIAFSKKMPLDIALFHIAGPYPGTPFFFDVIEHDWFRPGTQWEEVDMDRSTVLQYPELSAEQLEYWARRAFREWAFRPRPLLTFLKMLTTDVYTFKLAVDAGLQHIGWASK